MLDDTDRLTVPLTQLPARPTRSTPLLKAISLYRGPVAHGHEHAEPNRSIDEAWLAPQCLLSQAHRLRAVCGWVGGGAQDSDPPGAVLDHRQGVGCSAIQQVHGEEVAGQGRFGLRAEKLGPGRAVARIDFSAPSAVMRNCLRIRGATLSQRSAIRFKHFDLALLSDARLFHTIGRGNSWWEMRLRDARGRWMAIRLNGHPSAERQRFMCALQSYLDRPLVQVEGLFAEASADGLWWSRRQGSAGRQPYRR